MSNTLDTINEIEKLLDAVRDTISKGPEGKLNPIERFLAIHTESSKEAYVRRSVLWLKFKKWLEDNELEPIGKYAFNNALREMGYVYMNTTRVDTDGKRHHMNVWKGMLFKE